MKFLRLWIENEGAYHRVNNKHFIEECYKRKAHDHVLQQDFDEC